MAEARPPSTEEYLAAGFFEPDFDPVAHIFVSITCLYHAGF